MSIVHRRVAAENGDRVNSVLRVRKNRRGGAMIELVLVAPLYLMIFFGGFMMGDFMFVQAKAEMAARYAAWTRNGKARGKAEKKFFSGLRVRNPDMVRVTEDLAKAGRYPGDESPSQAVHTRQLSRNALERAANGGNPVKVAAIAYDGNDHNGVNYYGPTSHQQGGGWIVEQRALVRFRYKPMGMNYMPTMTLGASAAALNGKENGSMYGSGSSLSAGFKFRDTKVKSGDADNTSAEVAGMVDNLWPPAPRVGYGP